MVSFVKNVFVAGSVVLLILASVIALATKFTIPGGYSVYSVLTGSMEPTLQTGSLIITRIPVSVQDIHQDDIITFMEPGYENKFITHRVYKVVDQGPVRLFETKGDTNESKDSWKIAYGSIKGNYVYGASYLGYLLNFVKSPIGLALFVFIPVAILAFSEIKTIFSIVVQMKLQKIQKSKPMNSSTLSIISIPLASVILLAASSQNASALFVSSSVAVHGSIITTTAFTPTPTPSPTGTCPKIPDIIIEGNGAGSVNTVEVDIVCTSLVNQSNSTTIQNSITIHNSQ